MFENKYLVERTHFKKTNFKNKRIAMYVYPYHSRMKNKASLINHLKGAKSVGSPTCVMSLQLGQ